MARTSSLLQVIRAEVPAELLHEEVCPVLFKQLTQAKLRLLLLTADVLRALSASITDVEKLVSLLLLLLLLLDVYVMLLRGLLI